MSEQAPERVTAESLKSWLWNNRERQAQVAKRLFVSDRTIDNWRTKKNEIPDQYHEPLLKMMRGEDEILLEVPATLKKRLADAATSKGYPNVQAFLTDVLNKFFAAALLGLTVYQLSHPDKFARRFVRRQDCEVAGILAEA